MLQFLNGSWQWLVAVVGFCSVGITLLNASNLGCGADHRGEICDWVGFLRWTKMVGIELEMCLNIQLPLFEIAEVTKYLIKTKTYKRGPRGIPRTCKTRYRRTSIRHKTQSITNNNTHMDVSKCSI